MVFNVTVSDSAGQTRHRVTLSDDTYQQLGEGKATPTACIEAALDFCSSVKQEAISCPAST